MAETKTETEAQTETKIKAKTKKETKAETRTETKTDKAKVKDEKQKHAIRTETAAQTFWIRSHFLFRS
jgi:hypothetical protein